MQKATKRIVANSNKQSMKYLALCLFLFAYLVVAILGVADPAIGVWVSTMMCLGFLVPFVNLRTGFYFRPSNLYVLSLVIFILARPIIHVFYDVELVEVGNGISDNNIFLTLMVVCASIWLTLVGFWLQPSSRLFNLYWLKVKYIPHGNSKLTLIFYLVAGVLSVLFLYYSNIVRGEIDDIGYFAVAEDKGSHQHITIFLALKWLCVVMLLFTRSNANFLRFSLVVLIASFGFLLIGLRGYFISYLFLFLYFLNEQRRFSPIQVICVAAVLLLGSSIILENRLGFSVYNDIYAMLYMPFYQQGATFEVVFGALTFSESLNECIGFDDYFLKTVDFGACVDKIRGVPFLEGGFASSFIAESFYLGLLPFALLNLMIGFVVNSLDQVAASRFLNQVDSQPILGGLFLLLTIPNLVYLGRSSAFDLPVKFLAALGILYVYYICSIKWKTINKL